MTQTDIIQGIDKVFANITTAWAQGNITDEYREAVSEALNKAYKEAIKNVKGNK